MERSGLIERRSISPDISEHSPEGSPTPEQQAVVDVSADGAALVLAGPGTGKTFTLVARVGRLLEQGRQPLVLSFTRAVVRELHDRLRLTGSDAARYLRPVTFDSFATRMLSAIPSLAGWRNWETSSYDGRITAATAALELDQEAQQWVADRFDHVVVDEVQDLVGRRARLVLSLLELIPAFTLFGDPAQGIYGWQDDAEGLTADEFRVHVQESRGDSLALRELTVNHRARSEEIRRLGALRPELITLDDDAATHELLLRRLTSSQPLGTLEEATGLLTLLRGRTALLCRTNLEALKVSESLFSAGIDHVLRRPATDRAVLPWIAEIVRGRRGALSRTSFEQRYAEATLADDLNADTAWDLLTQVSDTDDRLALDRLADAVRRGRLPDELQVGPEARIVVSTIHRAKGLEFEGVAVVVPPDWRRDSDPGEEARVLFVAMTRARDELLHIDALDTFGWRQDSVIDRWYRCTPRDVWKTLGFELKGDDTHKMHPAGAHLFYEDPGAVQDRLRDDVRRGDSVELELAMADDGDEPRAWYLVHHAAGTIGVTSEEFGRALARRLRAKRNTPNRWPVTIDQLRVEGIDTVAGLEGVGQSAGLGASGIWLRARIVGLGRVNWKES